MLRLTCWFAGLVVIVSFVSARADAEAGNPVQGTVKLLERLQRQIQAEGKAEAAAYDKFACWCKDQADDKLYSITRKTTRIEELSAEIKKLDAAILDYSSQLDKAEKRKAALAQESEEAAKQNVADHEAFLKQRAHKEEGIKQLETAIKTIKATSDTLESSAGQSLLLLQKREDPKAYATKSDKTEKMLAKMHKEFERDLKRSDEYEAERKHQANMEEGARLNEVMAVDNKILKMRKLVGEKTSNKNAAESEKTQVDNDRGEDKEYLGSVTETCEDKAVKWDERSKHRYEELSAVSECIKILKGGAVKAYKSNRLIAVGQQKGVSHEKRSALAFLQVASSRGIAQTRTIEFLSKKGSQLKSSTLEALAMALRTSPFDSVKSMIEELITKIDEEQSGEEDEIAACKDDISDSTRKRASTLAKAEEEQAQILQLKRKVVVDTSSIKELDSEISQLYKSLNEATELRNSEKRENAVALSDAQAGKSAVDAAIKVLEGFYGSFVQEVPPSASSYDPPKHHLQHAHAAQHKKMALAKSRAAVAKKTTDPEIPGGGDFLGGDGDAPDDPSKGKEAQGILGLLSTIQGDFSSTIAIVEDDEGAAESEYEAYKTKTETDITSKKDELESTERSKRDAEDDRESAAQDLESWRKQTAEAEHELSILKPRCLGLGASAKQRKERREEEKASLQEAINIISAMAPAEAKEK